MSAGGKRIRHASWCPAPVPRRPIQKGKGVVARPKPFDCLCKGGRLQLSDPRPEVVEAAVARAKERMP